MSAFWIAVLVSILPLWLLQNIIHETAHALTAYFGWSWKFSIYPFPSMKLGYFTFAHCKYWSVENSKEISPTGNGIIAIMPRIVNMLFIIIGMIFCAINNQTVIGVFLVFCWCNFIDFVFGLSTIFRKQPKDSVDLWKFQKAFNFSINKIRIYSIVLILVFLTGLVCLTVLGL